MGGGAVCFSCGRGTGAEPGARVFRSDGCPGCAAPLKACRMCRFHDPAAYNGCREERAERVLDKEAANHCDYFVLAGAGAADDAGDAGAAARAAEALFRGGGG